MLLESICYTSLMISMMHELGLQTEGKGAMGEDVGILQIVHRIYDSSDHVSFPRCNGIDVNNELIVKTKQVESSFKMIITHIEIQTPALHPGSIQQQIDSEAKLCPSRAFTPCFHSRPCSLLQQAP